jgi:hypothetical protein
MPGKDGLEFLEMLRKNGNTIPFIMFTGKGREEVAIRALNLGANQYLDKTGETETVYTELGHSIAELSKIKKAEEKVKKASEEWIKTFEAIRDFVFILDREHRIVKANKAMCEALNKRPDELVGKHCYEVVHGTLEPWPDCPLSKTLTTRMPETAEIRDPRLGISLLVSNSPIYDEKGEFTQCVHFAKDITEREVMEKTIRESEKKWRSLVDMAPDGILTADLKGVITSANNAFLKLTGYTHEEIVGKHFTKLHTIPVKDIPRYAKLMIPALGGKLPPPFEYSYKRKDGSIGWAEARIGVLAKDGKTIGFQAFLRETTERKKAEEALRESEEKYRDLFENAMDVILTLDLKGSITAVNNSVLRFGYKKEDLVGKNILDFVSKEYWPAVMKDFSKVTQGEPAKNETELAAPAGKILVEYNARATAKENNVAGVQINMRYD